MRAVGGLLGLKASTISRIESGDRRFAYLLVNPRVTAARLGISIVDLLRSCPQCGYTPRLATGARVAACPGRGRERSRVVLLPARSSACAYGGQPSLRGGGRPGADCRGSHWASAGLPDAGDHCGGGWCGSSSGRAGLLVTGGVVRRWS